MKKNVLITNTLFLFAYFFLPTLVFGQVKQFWGMTTAGGSGNNGVIFNTDGSGNNEAVKHIFGTQNPGSNPYYTNLVQSADGNLYGMTYQGGVNGLGVLFQFSTVTSVCLDLLDFAGTSNGSYPTGSLLLASDGNFYGMTSQGGASGWGVLFQFNPVTYTYTKKLDFTGVTNGSHPYGSLMQASDGNLYGMTEFGGANNDGVLFQYNPATSAFTKMIDFAGTANGSDPLGSLVQASDGNLYGMTSIGGLHNDGVLFQYNPASSILTKEIDFAGTANGKYPYGSLIQAVNGNLYGMTYNGGANNDGVIFQYSITGAMLTKKVDFAYTTSGAYPYGSLIQASDGYLYGMTEGGGVNAEGVLFKFNSDSSTFYKKLDFAGIFGTNGGNPYGTLMQATDGNLYGMTEAGGINNNGSLFQYNPATSTYSKEIDFAGATNGGNPYGALTFASDGNFYGMTYGGGEYGEGILFQFNPSTSIFTKKLDFSGTATGSYPYGTLLQASDGNLYGMTQGGGANGHGVLFQYIPASSTYTKEIDFAGATNGANPFGSLIQASDGNLYGMTYSGGIDSLGVLFQYNPATYAFAKKVDFTGTANGAYPFGSLVQASDGNLYGMTEAGGAGGYGVLFQYNPGTSTYAKKLDFAGQFGTSGGNPEGTLIQASDGNLYGMTEYYGVYSAGILFQYNPATSVFTKKLDFGSTNGANPIGSLLKASDGNLYGMTSGGGANDYGVLFQFNPITSAYTKKLDFAGPNGESPGYTNLLEIPVTITTASVNTSNCVGSVVSVPYTITGAYNTANIFTAQLSDANGSFAAPVNIGTRTSVLAGSINATIPLNTPGGSGYRIRVVSSSPAVTGSDNGVNITANILPTPVITGTLAFCFGKSTMLSTGLYNRYLWSTGASTQSINTSAANTFTVAVTDGNGCTGTSSSVTTIVNPLPTPSVSGILAFCSGSSTTLSTGSYSSYIWSTNATSQSINVNTANTFSVTVTDLNGCVGTSAAVTTVIHALPTPVISGVLTFCSAGSTTLSTGSYNSYLWSTNATSRSVNVNAAGTFTVAVTDANGCTGTSSSVTTRVNPSPTPSITGNLGFCAGSSTTLSVGSYSSYLWSTDATSQSINVSTSGSFAVTVKDGNGCTGTSSSVATIINALPTPVISGELIFCSGCSSTLSTGSYSSYLWSTSATTQSISVNTAATFSVSVIDSNGCSGTSSPVTTILHTLPTPVISGTTAFCIGNSSTLSTGTFNSYLWSTGETTQSINVDSGGIYTVVVTDDEGYFGTSPAVTVVVNPFPTATVSGGGAICGNATLTNVSVVLTGTAPWTLTYAIDGVDQAPITGIASSPYIIPGAALGVYTVSALSDANCTGISFTGTATTTLNPSTPTITATPSDTVFCSGARTAIVLSSNLTGTTWRYTPVVTVGTATGAASGTSIVISQILKNTGTMPAVVTYSITGSKGGCSSSINATVTVNPKTTGSATPASASICSASRPSITLNAGSVSGTIYTWTSLPGATITGSPSACSSNCGITISDSLYNTGPANASVIYNITPWANGCAGTLFKEIVTVRPVPVASTLSPNTSLCSGAKTAIVLTSTTGGTTYSYTDSLTTAPENGSITGFVSGSGARIAQAMVNTGTSQGVVTYTITPAYDGCPGNPINATVTVNPVPNGSASPTETILPGSQTATTLIPGTITGTTFTWIAGVNVSITGPPSSCSTSGGTCGISITDSLYNISVKSQNETYTITPWANGCAGTKFSHIVTVKPKPVATGQANYSVCSGGKTNIKLTSSTSGTAFNYTASLYSGTITGFSDGAASTIAEVLTNPGFTPGSIVYTITPDYLGSIGDPIYDTVTVNPVPNGAATPSPQGICSGSATGVTLLQGAVTGTSFTWTHSAVAFISGASTCATFGGACGSTISDVLVNSTSSAALIVYTITPWANGCAGTKFLEDVTVQVGTPVKPVINGQLYGICPATQQYTYTVSNLAAFNTITWSLPSGCTVAGGYTLQSNPIVITFPLAYVIDSVKATAVNLCGAASAVGFVKPSKTVMGFVLSGNKSGLCGLSGQVFTVTAAAGLSYNWSVSGTGITIASQNASTMTANFAGNFTSGTVSCTIGGCGSSETVNLPVTGACTAPATLTGTATVCADSGPYTYTAGASYGAASYVWTLPPGASAATLSTTGPSISVAYTGSSAGTLTVKAINNCGQASAAKSIIITVNCREAGAPADQTTAGSINAYPNPAHDKLNIEFNSSNDDSYVLKLMDITGRAVMNRVYTSQKGTNILEIDLAGYAKGIYMIVLNGGSAEYKERIIVE